MKPRLALAILIQCTAVASVAQAQQVDQVQVSASVMPVIQVTAQQGLLLGDIVAGETKRVNVDGSAIGAEIGGEQVGVFRIETGGRVFIRFDNLPNALLGTDASNSGVTLPIRFLTGWSTNPSGAATATPLDLTSAEGIGSAGNLYLFIGAEVDAPATQREGLYTTTITILVTYGLE
jgi:hypothetical protein